MTFANSVPETLLVTVTGRDRPGISARLLSTLSVFPVTVADLEQVVIGGRLLLGALLSVDERVRPGDSGAKAKRSSESGPLAFAAGMAGASSRIADVVIEASRRALGFPGWAGRV